MKAEEIPNLLTEAGLGKYPIKFGLDLLQEAVTAEDAWRRTGAFNCLFIGDVKPFEVEVLQRLKAKVKIMEQGGSREGRDFGPGMEARLTFAQWESRNAVPVMTEEQYWAVKAKMQQETERATRQAEFYNEATKAKDTHGLKSEVLPQPKSPEWPSIFDRLQGSNKALDELHEAIMQLEERLNPVLKPNPAVPGDGVNGCAMPPVSVINEELSNRVERLRLITGRIWDIHSRIDL